MNLKEFVHFQSSSIVIVPNPGITDSEHSNILYLNPDAFKQGQFEKFSLGRDKTFFF